jgi:2'-hydroxyisoflavone reductase
MRILILGGTEFLGRHLVEQALAKGHDVTLFNRGQTNPALFPHVEQLRGNRDGDLEALRHRRFDVAIDTSGYVPRVVRQSVQCLAEVVEHYTFVSSISVYQDFGKVGINEEDPVGILEDEASEDVGAFYGPLKACCEQELQSVFGTRALVVRPGLIVGPYDPTDRFTYWIRRFAQGGDVLVPGRRDRPIQWIDVRDLAAWIVTMAEQRMSGVFNATGPRTKWTMAEFVSALETDIPSSGKATWVDEDFLHAKEVKEWSELPLWISDETYWPGFLTADVRRAVQHGLTCRPARETILNTLGWDKTRPKDIPMKAGLSPERESKLLREWHAWGDKSTRISQ